MNNKKLWGGIGASALIAGTALYFGIRRYRNGHHNKSASKGRH